MLFAAQVFLWLMFYSFAGWVYESILCSITGRKLVNRGFLNGPYCPIYGWGAVRTVKEAAVNELMRTNRAQRAFVNPTYHTVKEEPNYVFFDIFKKHISLRIRFNCAAAQSLRLFCGKFRHRA